MTRLVRRLLAAVVGAATVLVTVAAPAMAQGTARQPTLDGFELRYLPAGLGGSSDFDYEYDDVRFVSRVWESGSDVLGWRVDLDVEVLRGSPLSGAQALHDWLVAYQERPPAEAVYHRIRVHGRPGWMGRDELFWLVRPGVAVVVRIDATRWSSDELRRTANGTCAPRPGRAGQAGSPGPLALATTRSISQ